MKNNNSPHSSVRFLPSRMAKLLCLSLLSASALFTSSQASSVETNKTPAVQTEAEDKKNEDWDVLNPPFPLKSLSIDTNETTWSSLDVTPDGKHFVFDMLGDIYIVDIDGGEAKPLTQDFAWNIQPSISPDGKSIAFISDRGGLSNIWTMDINGENLQQVTKEKGNLIHSPKWRPDGEYLVATKGIMSRRSIPAGEIWLYHRGGGDGVVLQKRNNGKKDQKNKADPSFSPDGRYVYYTRDVSPGFTFSYNRDPLKSIFAIHRYDLEKGENESFVSGTGGAIVPTPSPDGKQLAFLRRVKEKTALFVKNLENGQETAINLNMEHDNQEGFGSEGYYPYFDWTPNSKSIVFWTGGKFHRINVDTHVINTVPVNVQAKVQYADALRFKVDVAPEKFDVKMLRWTQKSPDGKYYIYQALGKLYLREVATGKVRRLTDQNSNDEFYPRFSHDGKHVVYTTWNDTDLGSVKMASVKRGRITTLTQAPGHYIAPSFSTDDKLVTYQKFTGGYLLPAKWSVEPGVYVVDVKTKTNKRVSKSGSNPHFAGNNQRVYFTASVPGTPYPERQLASVDLNGEDRREHLHGANKVQEYRLSPDGKWIAFVEQYNVHVAPFSEIGKRQSINATSTAFPANKLSSRAGEYLNWSADSQWVSWFHGPRYFERDMKDAFAFVPGAPEPLPEPNKEGIDLSFKHTFNKPSGYKALVGGNIVTMRNANLTQEVIENGTVLIKDNRIVVVGKNIDIPKGAQVIDVSGKTVIPGLIDAHAHGAQGRREIIPQQNWSQYSNVSFGVTTIHDPSNDTSEIFAAAELQKAGKIVAPRIYSTGTILYGAELLTHKAIVKNYDDALYHMQRLKDVGAISVKSYNQPARSQRQQIIAAAKELEMMVVPEGGGKFHQNMTMMMDGHTGLEHSIPIRKGYNDLNQVWPATGYGYTPTFVVSYGGMMGEEYWYDRTEVWKNPRLLRYTPSFLVDRRSIRRPTAPDEQYNHVRVAEYAKTLRELGVGVHIGAHGQREGLAAHWEMWIMEQGSFTPWEAIRGATIDGAKHLGMEDDIGSIESGKLADMVVIDGDVLNDISRSEYVTYTVLNGRVYEAATMNEVGSKKKRNKFFFEDDNNQFMPKETQLEIHAKQHRHHWVH